MLSRKIDALYDAEPRHRKRHDRLLARIQRRYRTVTETLLLGPLRIEFTRVAEPDAVLDQIVEEEDRREKLAGRRTESDELRLPYWAELWDSAVGMGVFLATQVDDPPRRTLDLGCGMGLAGTVATAMGHHVLMADLEPDALLFARLNSLPFASRVRTRRLNWQRDRLDERFDLILGADVLYDKLQWEHLEPFWRAHLTTGGTVLLGEPGRQTGDMFIDWIQSRKWRLQQVDVPATARSKAVRIFVIHPRA